MGSCLRKCPIFRQNKQINNDKQKLKEDFDDECESLINGDINQEYNSDTDESEEQKNQVEINIEETKNIVNDINQKNTVVYDGDLDIKRQKIECNLKVYLKNYSIKNTNNKMTIIYYTWEYQHNNLQKVTDLINEKQYTNNIDEHIKESKIIKQIDFNDNQQERKINVDQNQDQINISMNYSNYNDINQGDITQIMYIQYKKVLFFSPRDFLYIKINGFTSNQIANNTDNDENHHNISQNNMITDQSLQNLNHEKDNNINILNENLLNDQQQKIENEITFLIQKICQKQQLQNEMGYQASKSIELENFEEIDGKIRGNILISGTFYAKKQNCDKIFIQTLSQTDAKLNLPFSMTKGPTLKQIKTQIQKTISMLNQNLKHTQNI
ncbi:hypothetical protein PPERSA_01574 [Pseudocohnilembus persalinus]|uniref:Uncharacterized protein n=1 Tax=Pseudocohnilembus persalinus TaxID=266149 RepID=A0A0V0QHV1_PSEPJ|nr:hypothetical protein PPERSA_01574 [Pseudocohnilembus persalinus]|eukprot:KRX01704.1 hypothetical protein PPERSA_01574 [Pseudocohnilembus persalinus]